VVGLAREPFKLAIELALLKVTHRAMTRMLTLPPTHPLYSIVAHTRNNPPKKHASPIANLLRIFKMNRVTMETVLPAAQCPSRAMKFTTKVADSRKKSIEWEKTDDADFKVFSDGSGLEDGIGAAAVLYTKERLTPIGHLKASLGAPTKRNTYEAETIGAILAVWLLSTCPVTVGKKVSLYIDNQSVIASISNPKATSGQHLVRHLILLANSLACFLSIHWISSHSKVRGNEKVDELAKEAASGRSSAMVKLPHILRAPLPASASATKQAYHKRLKTKWDNIWEDSDRSTRINEIDENFPFNGFRKRTYTLSRLQASLMTQIRCGHIPLNGYLSRINRSDTEYCQACLDGEDNLHRRETVKHFLFVCPSLGQERELLVAKIGRNHLNIRDIMLNTDYMSALATFIN
jgi:ribonuclease HI